MKQAFTLLLTAAYVFAALPAFADEEAAATTNSASETTSAADKKAKADAKAKASETQSTEASSTDEKAKSDGDDKTKSDDKAKSDGDDKTKSDTTKKAKGAKTPAKGNIASRAASFVAGSIVGMPVAIAREIGGETKIATRDLVGETNNWFKIIPALPMGFIGGCLSAAPQGLMFGIKNAWEGSHDEPFGREAFSLADELEK